MFTVGVITHGVNVNLLQLRAFFRQIGYSNVPSAETELTADSCFKFWTYLLLQRFKFLSAEQRRLLFEELEPVLPAIREQLSTTPTPMVVIADSRYATWHGNVGWLDLYDGSKIAKPQYRPLETVAYDFSTLWERNQIACNAICRSLNHG